MQRIGIIFKGSRFSGDRRIVNNGHANESNSYSFYTNFKKIKTK
jgi:hypothetical protein